MRSLRLGTFNLENLDDRPNRDGVDFHDRLQVLQPQLTRLRADILCLQEVNSHPMGKHGPRPLSALQSLLDGTIYASYHQICSTNQGGEHPADHHNLVILSRYPILSHRQIWHHLVPPPLCSADSSQPVLWDRPILQAEILLPDGNVLTVINVHLRAPRAAWVAHEKLAAHGWRSVAGWAQGFFLASMKHAGQALEVRLACEQVFDLSPQALLAVCGDFNAADSEAPMRIIRGDEEDTGNGHLAMRSLIPVDRGIPVDRRHSAIHHGRPVMLDHILVSRPLLGGFRQVEIHNETLGDELTGPLEITAPPDSYHAPLVGEFGLQFPLSPGKGHSGRKSDC